MKRHYVPGIIDLFQVDDPKEIESLSNDPVIDREFATPTCPLNWYLMKRSLSVLSFNGKRFPTMLPRNSAASERSRDELWHRLSARVNDVRTGPTELEPIVAWIRGVGEEDEIGILTQNLIGRLFGNKFTATQESWAAARVLVTAPRSPNLLKIVWWFATGRIRRAKRRLVESVGGDLSAVNGIGIAVHNVVKGLHHMRMLYSDIGMRNTLSAAAAASQCLFAPVSLYRQSTQAGELGGCPFPKHSLFVLNVGEAAQQVGGGPLVFMEDTWSRCPAALWVPAMLQGAWSRATDPVAQR